MRCLWLTSRPGEAPFVVEAETREAALQQHGEATEAVPLTVDLYDEQVRREARALLDEVVDTAMRTLGWSRS